MGNSKNRKITNLKDQGKQRGNCLNDGTVDETRWFPFKTNTI